MLYEWCFHILHIIYNRISLKKNTQLCRKAGDFSKTILVQNILLQMQLCIIIIKFLIENIVTVKFPDKINRSFDSRQPIVYRPMKIDWK